MPELPTGTVTFLFTDIEGSTRLLETLGDDYADVLAEHRRILRDAFAAHDGVEVDTQGDAFFVAFQRATDAAAAAAEAQRVLAEGPVRVRMGIHTGEPIRTDEGYVGIDVHRAARIAAAGHGGQVLISQTSRDLLGGQVELRDLGEHRLKDLTEAQRIFQLGDGDSPPLNALYQTNLPVLPTPLIGRERELEEAGALLERSRLLTLVGPGGCGKTRLALQVAADQFEHFEDGVFWVPLGALRDPQLIESTIARVVGTKASLRQHLQERDVLLLLDNFEHLLGGVVVLTDLMQAAPTVTLLVTSRSPLGLSGEQEYPVPPLPRPDAVALFTERATAARPGFETDESVGEICRRLDGLPLAVELAAARVKILEPAAILARLEQRLPLLTGGPRDVPERQRTMRATIQWSHELLDEAEQLLFARLAVFAGGWDIGAAEEVCEADVEVVGSLVDKSLILQRRGRFSMLATIREYALERLDELGETSVVRRAHASHFLTLAEEISSSEVGGGDSETLAHLEREHDNLRVAMAWLRAEGDAEGQLRLAVALGNYCRIRGYAAEGLSWLRHALDSDAESSAEVRMRGFFWASNLAQRLHLPEAVPLAELSVALARTLDDERLLALSLTRLGNSLVEIDSEQAKTALTESRALNEKVEDHVGVAWAVHSLGLNALSRGDEQEAASLLAESVVLFRDVGLPGMIANALTDLGFVELGFGHRARARGLLVESTRLNQELGWKEGLAICLVGLAAILESDAALAAELLGAASNINESLGTALEPYALGVEQRTIASLKADLSEDRFREAWARGAELELDDAVSLALASLD
jgi:predicted ATPase